MLASHYKNRARLYIFAFFLITQGLFGQTLTSIDKTDKDNVYIPKNIYDAFKVLDKTMDSSERIIIRTFKEESAVEKLLKSGPPYFFYDWKFGDGEPSVIVSYFNSMGISHPYDLTRTVIISYHRYLNNVSIDLDKTIELIKRKREEEHKFYLAQLSKDSINGVYVPKDLKDCFIQLDKVLSAKDRQSIKALKNRAETIKYHHGLGMWIRNNWGLWSGSRLQRYFLD